MSFDRNQLLDIAAKQDAKEKERRASQVAQRKQEENAAAEMIQVPKPSGLGSVHTHGIH